MIDDGEICKYSESYKYYAVYEYYLYIVVSSSVELLVFCEIIRSTFKKILFLPAFYFKKKIDTVRLQ